MPESACIRQPPGERPAARRRRTSALARPTSAAKLQARRRRQPRLRLRILAHVCPQAFSVDAPALMRVAVSATSIPTSTCPSRLFCFFTSDSFRLVFVRPCRFVRRRFASGRRFAGPFVSTRPFLRRRPPRWRRPIQFQRQSLPASTPTSTSAPMRASDAAQASAPVRAFIPTRAASLGQAGP